VNYKPFLDLIKLRRSRAISEGHFILDWRLAQRDHGIVPPGRRGKILGRSDAKKTGQGETAEGKTYGLGGEAVQAAPGAAFALPSGGRAAVPGAEKMEVGI
jgi:hypothetical protein